MNTYQALYHDHFIITILVLALLLVVYRQTHGARREIATQIYKP